MVTPQDKQQLFFEKARIIVINNFFGSNETTLRKLFSKHGPIASIILVTELHQAFVTFYSFGSAETALKESDKWKINGKMIKVTRPELYHALRDELGSLVKVVSEISGEESSTPVASSDAQSNGKNANKKRNNKKRGEKKTASATPAGTEEEATAKPQKETKKKEKKQRPRLTDEELERAVFVSGPYALMKKPALIEFFKEVGQVQKVNLGFKQRYAHVLFETKALATQACNLDDMEYNEHERKVRVNMATSKKEKKEQKEEEETPQE